MKAGASKINRERRGVLKAISSTQGTEVVLTREYQTIFKNNGKPMVIVDDDATIFLANAEFERFSGYTKKEIEGTKKWTEFVAREDRRRMKEYHLLRKSDPMLAPRCCEFRLVDRNGKIKNVVLTIGQIPGTVKSMASLQDVTNRRQAEVTQRASEERYQTFFENSRDAVYITTRDGTYVDANRAALDLFGYNKEEMKKLKARQLYANPDDARRLRKEIEEKGFAQDFEVRLHKKDGTEMDCLFTVTALRGDDGSILEYQGIARDVTERKRAERAVRESEEKYRNIFDFMLEGYFEVDLSGIVTFFNQAVSKFFGYLHDELMGLNYRKFTSQEEAQRLFHIFSEVYKTGDTHEIDDYEIIKKDGSIGVAEFSVSLLRSAAGEPIGFRGVTRDVTERKKIEKVLWESEEKYRTILDTIEDGYYELDLTGNFTFVNNATCGHLGYTKEELIGMNNRAYTSPETAKKIYEIFNAIYKKGKSTNVFDYEAIRKDGTTITLELSVSLIRDAQGKPIGFRGISRDITNRKQAEEALRKSEEKYRGILENITEGYFENDLRGNLTFFNDSLVEVYGYARNELLHMNYRQYMDKDTAQRVSQAYNKVYTTGKPDRDIQYKIIRNDGTRRYLENSVTLMLDADGRPVGFRGVARDITERKQAEEKLRQSEERYRTILETMQEAYYETDLAGKFTFVNDALCGHLGYSKEELIEKDNRRFQDETTAKKIYQIYSEIYRTGEPVKAVESEYIRKDGTKGTYEMSASLIRDAQGKPLGFRGVSRDVTERKQAEEALRQSEERYRTIIENIQDGYFEVDLAGKYTFANDAECVSLGYPRDELIGMSNRQYMEKECAKKVFQAFNKLYKTGVPIKELDYEIIRKDGTKAFKEISPTLIRDSKGKTIGFRGITRDVTERKQAEEALRRSEERYRTILENMQDNYYEVDLAGNYTFVNDALCRNFGYTKEELMGTKSLQHQDEANAKKTYHAFKEIYRTGEPIKALEVEYARKDGVKRSYELSISLRRDAQGKPIGFGGITHDITERKQAEEALRQSEERYRTILETMQEAYYETDLTGHITFLNDALCRHLRYSKEEAIGMDFRQCQDEANAKKTYEAFKEIYRTGEPIKAREAEYIRKDGAKGTYELSVSLMRDAQGKPIGFRGVSRDVTERKQVEESLRLSEEKYRTILESIEDGYGELDLGGKLIFFNDALPRVLGYPEDELKKLHFKNRQYIDEENAEKVRQAYTQVYSTGKPNRGFQYEIIAQDGTRRYLESSISLRKNAGGQPVGFQGVVRDISERKQAEEALRQSEERYRTILENMQEAYYEIDLAGHLTFVNDAVCRHLGYTKEELIGMHYRQYQDETTAKKMYQIYNEVYKKGEPVRAVESEYTRKDGTKGTYELSVSLIRDAQGNPIGFRGVSRDVTERKQMEDELRRSEERYRTIIENIEDGYYESDLAGRFTFVNDMVGKNIGYTREELIGKDNRQFQDETTAKQMYQLYKEVYRTGEPVRAVESEYIRKDGTKRTYEMSVSLIRDAQDKPIGFRGISRDVTERKKAEEQLKRYAAELERSNEEVKNFAYIVSHDLRVPLVNLKGYTSELRTALGVIGANFDAALPHLNDEKRSEVAMALHEDVPEALEFISNSVSRMDSFINAILILSRLGRQDLKPEPIDMSALVKTTLETMSHQIKAHGIEVRVGFLPQVVADRTAMERIMGNILSNAVKYADSSRPCRIEVAAEAKNGETIFTIQDTGRGIAQEDMHKVFAPFRRAGKQDTQGEGMGLAYVQTLVRRHGGRIWCESEPGKGTTFTFTISTTFKQGASDA